MDRIVDNVAVCIATFGSSEWRQRAQGAIESVNAQTVKVPWHHVHYPDASTSLGNIRNSAANAASYESPNLEWLIFLDGDDTLAEDYVEKMLEGTGDIRQPSTLGVRESDGVEDPFPTLIPRHKLINQNFIVIGAMLNADLFFQVGGFGDYVQIEDWELFLRMYIAGAEITACPEAVYKICVRENSRNTADQTEIYREIRERHLAAFNARGWEK